MFQTQRREEKKWQGKNIVNVGWREGIREERRKGRKLAEAQLCAANVVQAWLIQQRLLWRPTMRLWGAQTAETRRERREEGAGNKRGGGYCQQKKNLHLKNHLTLISVWMLFCAPIFVPGATTNARKWAKARGWPPHKRGNRYLLV